MKKYFILFFALLVASITSNAQDWQTDFAIAKQTAVKNNQQILLVFQGSDWCAPCMKLDKQIFKTDEFQSFIKNKFVMVKADFPRKKSNKLSPEQEAQNKILAEKYNSQGFFPLVVVLDKNGKALGKLGYENISPKEYFTKILALK